MDMETVDNQHYRMSVSLVKAEGREGPRFLQIADVL
jgi:hypothetical protein